MKIRRFMTMKEVTDGFGVSRRTIYNWIECEGFPKPVKLSKRKILFSTDEVERYLKDRSDRRIT